MYGVVNLHLNVRQCPEFEGYFNFGGVEYSISGMVELIT